MFQHDEILPAPAQILFLLTQLPRRPPSLLPDLLQLLEPSVVLLLECSAHLFYFGLAVLNLLLSLLSNILESLCLMKLFPLGESSSVLVLAAVNLLANCCRPVLEGEYFLGGFLLAGVQLQDFGLDLQFLILQFFDQVGCLPPADVESVEGDISANVLVGCSELFDLGLGFPDLPFHFLPVSVFQVLASDLQVLQFDLALLCHLAQYAFFLLQQLIGIVQGLLRGTGLTLPDWDGDEVS